MLVLGRMPGQRIVVQVGDKRIYISNQSVSGNKCRIGIEADPSVTIDREEIFKKIEKEGRHQHENQRE